MDMVTLERRLRAVEDIEQIRQLKARYLAACDRKDPKAMRACFADAPVHIDYGAIGTFDDADALVKVYTQIACHPHMVELHHGANPQIEVTDIDRARGTWSLQYLLINTRDKTLTQLAGHYEDEYRRCDTGWKIARTKFVPSLTLSSDYGEGAAKVVFAGRPS
jgi:hypothetical protein